MSEAKTVEPAETTETTTMPDVFDGDSVSSDPEWQAAMEGPETGGDEGVESAETVAEAPAEKPEAVEDKSEQEAGTAPAEAATEPEEASEDLVEEKKSSPQVPIQALHQEREKRQNLEKELLELKGQIANPPVPPVDRGAEVQKLMETQDLTQTEAEIRFDQEEIKQEQAEQKEFRANLEKQQAQQVEVQQVQSQYSAAASKFAEKQTDFNDAYDFALNAKAAQLRFEHPQATEAQINNAIFASEIQLAAASIKAGRDPAEVVYQYAQTFGYQAPNGDGGTAPAEKTDSNKAELKLRNINKGEAASRSASGGASGDTGEGLTFDSLKNKSGKEFDQGWNELVPSNDDIFNT